MKLKTAKRNYSYQNLAALSVLISIVAIAIDILGVMHFKVDGSGIMMSDFCLSHEVVVTAVFTTLLLIVALIISGKRNVLSGVSHICTAATYISFCGTIIHTIYYILIWIKHSKLVDLLERIPIL